MRMNWKSNIIFRVFIIYAFVAKAYRARFSKFKDLSYHLWIYYHNWDYWKPICDICDNSKQQVENETPQEKIPAAEVYKNTSKNTIRSFGTINAAKTKADKKQQLLSNEKNLAMHHDAVATGSERNEIYIADLEHRKTNMLLSKDELVVNPETTRYAVSSPFEIEKEKLEPFDNKRKVGIGAFYAPTWNGSDVLTAKNAIYAA